MMFFIISKLNIDKSSKFREKMTFPVNHTEDNPFQIVDLKKRKYGEVGGSNSAPLANGYRCFCAKLSPSQPANPQLGAEIALVSQLWGTTIHPE